MSKTKKEYRHSDQVGNLGFCTMALSVYKGKDKKKNKKCKKYLRNSFELIDLEDGVIIDEGSYISITKKMNKRNAKATKQLKAVLKELDKLHSKVTILTKATVKTMPKFVSMVDNLEVMFGPAQLKEEETKETKEATAASRVIRPSVTNKN